MGHVIGYYFKKKQNEIYTMSITEQKWTQEVLMPWSMNMISLIYEKLGRDTEKCKKKNYGIM